MILSSSLQKEIYSSRHQSSSLFSVEVKELSSSSMDPCQFVRILVGNLALKFPVASKPTFSGIHPSTSPCYCRIKLSSFGSQTATIPLIPSETQYPETLSQSACFTLNQSDIIKLVEKRLFSKNPCLKIDIYTGKRGSSCGLSSGKLLGSLSLPLDLRGSDFSKSVVYHNGWVSIGADRKGSAKAQLYLSVKAEPDPRFVFEFGKEPECSPQVFQVQGNVKQPVFSCKFSQRSSSDRNLGARSFTEQSTSKSWLGHEKDNSSKERKGWSITIHDLSGSPVAAASMVTPFVPSPGSDRVSRSNPGAWLILRPSDCTWQPWGRLEAWRERGSPDKLGYRFNLVPDISAGPTTVATASISTKNGGKFSIDISNATPVPSPKSSGDFGHVFSPVMRNGFVMSSTVEGFGKSSSKPEVEVGVRHVTCTEDAAVFVALAAAIDLSMDACKLFSQKLRKELRHTGQEAFC